MHEQFNSFYQKLLTCNRCPRLVRHRQTVEIKSQPKIWRGTDYWSKPVPGFGDYNARILIIGLAPGLHGANRTGRPFTGDGAGIFLYKALYEMGWSNKPEAISRNDGMVLKDVFISNIVKCAPPGNVPVADEKNNCQPYLKQEIGLLKKLQLIITLGSVAHQEVFRILKKEKIIQKLSDYKFKHGAVHQINKNGWTYPVLNCFHPSTYNVNTGVLTFDMMLEVFRKAVSLLD